MKIEIWSDYVCPFCYIGKRTMEKALEKSGFHSQAEITYKAFQLNPETPVDSTVSTYEALAKKFGSSVDEAREMTKGVAEHARSVGLEYNFDDMVEANTLAAHRLVKWAEESNKDGALAEQLLHSYFIEAENVGKHNILLAAAEKVGLPREEAKAVLASDRYATEVERDIEEARQIGVQGVPFFVINRKYAISGAQPLQAFVDSIVQIAEEEGIRPKLKPMGQSKTSYCTGDSCEA